jgi:hypothetical protein
MTRPFYEYVHIIGTDSTAEFHNQIKCLLCKRHLGHSFRMVRSISDIKVAG